METKPKMETSGSPVPGVIPGPIRVHHDSAAAHEGHHAAARPSTTTEAASSPGRRNPASMVLAKLLGAVRGEKRPADLHPPARRTSAAERVGDDSAAAPYQRTQPAPERAEPRVAPAPSATIALPDLVRLEAEERYHRERLALYRARSYSSRPTSPARLHELGRIWEAAKARLTHARSRRR